MDNYLFKAYFLHLLQLPRSGGTGNKSVRWKPNASFWLCK